MVASVRREGETDADQSTIARAAPFLLDILSIVNAPKRDEAMLELAAPASERALFPLLVLVDKYGPIGVVHRASRVGLDYMTVSSHLARLEEIGLIEPRAHGDDRRMREAIITRREARDNCC